jgi:hypothetical protein
MSDASFLAEIGPSCHEVATATGLDCRLFMVQWALESFWGTSQVASHNNFAGIEAPSAGKGCTCCIGGFTVCPSLADFTALYIAIFTQGTYASVIATHGQSLANQFAALGRSPWAASHYATGCGAAGCELANLYASEQALFDAAAAAACGTTNPCAGVTCQACYACAGGVCVDQCATGWTCVAGVCTPPGSPPPTSSAGPYLAIGVALLGTIGVLAIIEAQRHPAAARGVEARLARLEGGGSGLGGGTPMSRAARMTPVREARSVSVDAGGLGRRRV